MRNFKLKSFLLTLAMMLTTVAASAVTFTVKVGNPDAVKCSVNGTIKALTAGDNLFDVPEYTPINFSSVDPYYIKNVTNQHGTTASGYYKGLWNIQPTSSDEGFVYTIETINLDEVRKSTFTINVDDPLLVWAQLSGYDKVLDLSAGSNTIKFDEATENILGISPRTFNKPIYEVKLNGEVVDVQSQSGAYYITLTNGCTVDITAVIPDIDINVTFKYTSEEAKGAIESAFINDQEVTDFNGTSLTMKAGQVLALRDNPNYKIESVKFNGVESGWAGGYHYSRTMMADTEIEVTAHPYGTFTATIDIDDPSNAIIYRGYPYQKDILKLNAGKNEVIVSENNPVISWEKAAGSYITSVTANGQLLDDEYQTNYTLTGDATLIFVTSKIVMDKKAQVWVNDLAKASHYFNFLGYDRSNIPLENGYNEVLFYEKMTPFSAGWSGPDLTANQVYINDILQAPRYEGSSTWELPIKDGDIVKLYIGEEAVNCAVTFDAAETTEATVVYDRIISVSDWRAGFNCLSGTEVSISGSGLILAVNGTTLEPNAEGNYVFTVTEATTLVKITEDENSGVENVAADNIAEDAPVYNLNGVRVATRATAGNLPAGIYVIDGRKIVVRN